MGFSSISHLKDQRPSVFPDPPPPWCPNSRTWTHRHLSAGTQGLSQEGLGVLPAPGQVPAVGWGLELEGGASSPGWL